MMSNRFSYCLFVVGADPRLALIETLDQCVDSYRLLSKCVRLGSKYPPDVELKLAPDGGDWITDFIDNVHSVVIVSDKVKAVMESEGLDDLKIEYLPFLLRDKRGGVVDDGRFYVANALQQVNCFDWERSTYKTYPNKPAELSFSGMRRMFLREDAIPSDTKFFRLGEQPKRIIIRSDLLQRLRDEGCTGINVTPMGEELL